MELVWRSEEREATAAGDALRWRLPPRERDGERKLGREREIEGIAGTNAQHKRTSNISLPHVK
jgi:hypothetical protein